MSGAETAQRAWVERVLGVRLAAAGGGDAMAGWTAARGAALGTLTALEAAYRGMRHPLSDRAIVLVRAIRANLTAEPGTPAQVAALQTYLAGDRIITEAEMPNGFGFTVDLRGPLLAALARLQRQQEGAAS